MNTQDERLGTPRVCALTGLSFRQLDYWIRIKIITPSVHVGQGSGHYHEWSAEDVRILRVLSDLRSTGELTSVFADLVEELRGADWNALLVIIGDEIMIRTDLPDTHRPYTVVPLAQYLTGGPRQYMVRNHTTTAY
jgi:hypothetical protein